MSKPQPSTPKPIADTLAERGSRYGVFAEHARISQNIKSAMRDSPNWDLLRADQREALEMNAHKTARILNGDPYYHDSWHDIVGYTQLVAGTLVNLVSSVQSAPGGTTTPNGGAVAGGGANEAPRPRLPVGGVEAYVPLGAGLTTPVARTVKKALRK